jgi:hypothetical protein
MPRKRTRFDDLAVAAEEMTQAEIHEYLRQLARDERFAAVVGWLSKSEAAWRVQVAAVADRAEGQQLAVATGGMSAVMRLKAHLGEIIKKAAPSQPASPGD